MEPRLSLSLRKLSRIRTTSFVLVGMFFIFLGQVVLISVHLDHSQHYNQQDGNLHYPSWLSSFSSLSSRSSASTRPDNAKQRQGRPQRSWQIDPPVWEKDVHKFIQKSNTISIHLPTTATSSSSSTSTTPKTTTAMTMTSKKEGSYIGKIQQGSVTIPKGTTTNINGPSGQQQPEQAIKISTTKAPANNSKMMMRKRRRVKPWDPGENAITLTNPMPLNINTPIFVPSLPKSGTTSIWQYFKCGGHAASHQWVKKANNKNNNTSIQIQSGQCIWDNVNAGLPPFENCGDYSIYTDTGFALYTQTGGSVCYYPSVDALQEIYDAYPTATFLMVIRNATEWYTSMSAWGDGSLLDRWRPCNATGWPGWNATAQDWINFYEWHNNNIRRFVAMHPSIKYIEVELESIETGSVLEQEVGIPASCWGKCTPASKFCKRIIPTATGTAAITAVETNLNTTTISSK